MRKRQILAAVVLVGLLGAVAIGQFYEGAFGPLPERRFFLGDGMPVEMNEFRGEIVVVPHKGSDGQQVISGLLKPRVRHLGQRQYLVGEDVATQGVGRGRDMNVTAWIPLEQTSGLFEYRSVEDARKVWNLGRRAEEAAEESVEAFEEPRESRPNGHRS